MCVQEREKEGSGERKGVQERERGCRREKDLSRDQQRHVAVLCWLKWEASRETVQARWEPCPVSPKTVEGAICAKCPVNGLYWSFSLKEMTIFLFLIKTPCIYHPLNKI